MLQTSICYHVILMYNHYFKRNATGFVAQTVLPLLHFVILLFTIYQLFNVT